MSAESAPSIARAEEEVRGSYSGWISLRTDRDIATLLEMVRARLNMQDPHGHRAPCGLRSLVVEHHREASWTFRASTRVRSRRRLDVIEGLADPHAAQMCILSQYGIYSRVGLRMYAPGLSRMWARIRRALPTT